MAEHRWFRSVDPSAELCECDLCSRHDAWMVQMEADVARPVDALLAAGWLPDEIVKLVKTGSPSSSRSSMLVRVDIVRRVPAWLDDRETSTHIAQAYRLSKRTGFVFGATAAGWFESWFWHRGGGDIRKTQRYVRHIGIATAPVLELLLPELESADEAARPGDQRHVSASSHRGQRRQGLRRSRDLRGLFVPEPGDPQWSS